VSPKLIIGIFFLRALYAAPGPTEFHTLVEPLPNENIPSACQYELWLPGSGHRIYAVWIIFERGQDTVRLYEDRAVRKFASGHRLGLVLAHHCRSKDREDMDVEPSHGIGRALFQALDQFSENSAHSELRSCKLVLLGWSGAGSLVARLPGFAHKRILAVIAYAPGQYDPLGMDTIELSRDAAAVPQLVIANGADSVNGTARPYGYFARYWSRGAPWTFVIQNGTSHCCLQNVEMLILAWLEAVEASEGRGGHARFGYLRLKESEVRDTWHLPVSNILNARVSVRRESSISDEVPAGLVSGGRFAREWLLLARLGNTKKSR